MLMMLLMRVLTQPWARATGRVYARGIAPAAGYGSRCRRRGALARRRPLSLLTRTLGLLANVNAKYGTKEREHGKGLVSLALVCSMILMAPSLAGSLVKQPRQQSSLLTLRAVGGIWTTTITRYIEGQLACQGSRQQETCLLCAFRIRWTRSKNVGDNIRI